MVLIVKPGDLLLLPLNGYQPPAGWAMLNEHTAYRVIDGTEPDTVTVGDTSVELDGLPLARWA